MSPTLELPAWSALPFVATLLAIALGPLVAPRFWERSRNQAIVTAALALPFALFIALVYGRPGLHALGERLEEYVSFIALLGSLYVISGGIHVRGSLSGTPLLNTALIGAGAVLASWIGTTGASMVLIRPLLRANESRERTGHVVVFFIFVVSNCGGLLTPLGDPPLFLGFLKGVPFGWTLGLWPVWLFVNGVLLVVFHVWDQVVLDREERERPGSQLEDVMRHEPLAVDGLRNVLFLVLVPVVLMAAGRRVGTSGEPWPFGLQEALLVLVAATAYLATDPAVRRANRFDFGPIVEVAILFGGLFVTILPALLLLNLHGADLMLTRPWHYFWATGLLSSFLDNAPTYLAMTATASGASGIQIEGLYLASYLAASPEHATVLAAISCGAVLMGANTYIGNGPNFMVKSIAEQQGVPMPGFFGYMVYAAAVLVPVFAAASWQFFR